MEKKNRNGYTLWIFCVVCRISKPFKCRFEVSLNNPPLQHHMLCASVGHGSFVYSLCSVGEARRRLVKHYLLPYIIIKLVPKGGETSAVEVDSYEINGLDSVCAICLWWYVVKIPSLGCTVAEVYTSTHVSHLQSTAATSSFLLHCACYSSLECKPCMCIQSDCNGE